MDYKKIPTTIIYYSFLAAFFITPLLVSITSSELFEFPKMLFMYSIAIVVGTAWLFDIFLSGKLRFKRSMLDIPLLAIVLTQGISTVFSIHPLTSWYGYYSRFNGSFLSTLAYALLAWAFITFGKKSWFRQMLFASLAAASVSCLYGVAEHFGIDAAMWVQDVQNRVFSTLGQPNWLAAWLVALLPITMLWFLKPPKSLWSIVITVNIATTTIAYGMTYLFTQNPLPFYGNSLLMMLSILVVLNGAVLAQASKIRQALPWLDKATYALLFILFTATILFTKSRSGILAMLATLAIFWLSWFIHQNQKKQSDFFKKTKFTKFIILNACFLALLLFIGTEWTPNLAQLTGSSQKLVKNPLQENAVKPEASGLIISDSTDIRQVVWEGALKTWRRYPLFGAGTETFAYSYYQSRLREHNDLSEWDFLYNKAHNEYLNFLANNGLLGLTAIFLLMVVTIWLCIKPYFLAFAKHCGAALILGVIIWLIKPIFFTTIVNKLLIYPSLAIPLGIALALATGITILLILFSKQKIKASAFDSVVLASLVGIVITNFYGFSVVNVALLFFLLPAMMLVYKNLTQEKNLLLRQDELGGKRIPSLFEIALGGVIIFGGLFGLIQVYQYFKADQNYSFAKAYDSQGDVLNASKYIDQALSINPNEPNYNLQKATAAAKAAWLVYSQDASDSAGLVKTLSEQADTYNQLSLKLNPVHINNLKVIAKNYITLSLIDPIYIQKAIDAMKKGWQLSPTDAQLPVNIALLVQEQGKYDEAEQLFIKATQLKPNFARAWQLLADLYGEQGQYDKAIKAHEYVLKNVNPQDTTSIIKLKELQEKKKAQ
ncbi:O-antigen ligase family protein [Candidatus Beckwithbacteria bacterium]|nr:O-antigen ligase family protein [Candidatus Beckwithbacteria bacterium]